MNNYFDRTRKLVTLPSGATVLIRKITAGDFRGITSEVPVLDGFRKSGHIPTEAEVAQAVKMATRILTLCCGAFKYQGETYRIVDKPFSDPGLKEDELPIELLDQADAEAIISAVHEFSGLLKGGGQNGRTFQQGATADVLPPGEAVREMAASGNGTNP